MAIWLIPIALVAVLIVFLATPILDCRGKHFRATTVETFTDEEFVKACSIKDPEIALGVRQMVAEWSGNDPQHIHPNDRFRDIGLW